MVFDAVPGGGGDVSDAPFDAPADDSGGGGDVCDAPCDAPGRFDEGVGEAGV